MTSRIVAYGTAATVFLIDRISKEMIQAHVSFWDTYEVIPGFFNIVHTENRGAAFGLFANADSEWRTFFLLGLSVLVLALVATFLWQPSARGASGSPAFRVALSLVLGGALGNIYDRLATGAVTDFLDFYIKGFHWPAFNVADSAITIGAGLLIMELWRSRHKVVET